MNRSPESGGVSERNAAIISQGPVRRTVGAGTDLLRRAGWNLGVFASSTSLTPQYRQEFLASRQSAREDIAERAHMRSIARSARRDLLQEPAVREGRKRRNRRIVNVTLGVAGVAGAAGLAINVPAAFSATAAEVQHNKVALADARAIAAGFSQDAQVILDSSLKKAQADNNTLTAAQAGQELHDVLTEEHMVVKNGSPLYDRAQKEIAAGESDGASVNLDMGLSAVSTVGVAASAMGLVGLYALRRRDSLFK